MHLVAQIFVSILTCF